MSDPLETSAPVSVAHPTTKTCKHCAAHIPLGARLCKECKSYQDWRGWLPISQTTLALVVALVSVLTAAAPTVQELITEKNSRLSMNYIGTSNGEVLMATTNAGNRPGTVLEGKIYVGITGNDSGKMTYPLQVKGERSVAPGALRTTALIMTVPQPEMEADLAKVKERLTFECSILASAVQFNGQRLDVRFDKPCKELLAGIYPGEDFIGYNMGIWQTVRSMREMVEDMRKKKKE